MTTMPLTYPGFSRPRPARQPDVATPFQPLDATVISAAIPTFFVGRNRDGFWLARDASGTNGGIFLFRSSAIAFARHIARPLGCAIVLFSGRFELDLENQGNPLAGYLKPLLMLVSLAGKDAGQ